jgi:hypothetical protein
MAKYSIIKTNLFENYYKNKNTLCIIIFTFGVIILLYYISIMKNQTKIIENYSSAELTQIAKKIDKADSKNMDISGLLKMDLGALIKRLFGSKCLPGCMSPDNTNRKDSMCQRNIKEDDSVVFECPWRCNIPEFKKLMNVSLMFKKDILSNKLKMCSQETENIDCGGCVPLRVFD